MSTYQIREDPVSHPDDDSEVVTVRPPLAAAEVELIAGLAGVGSGPRRVWPGQPGRRSPWLPCSGGCCLVVGPRAGGDPVAWLRFLLREVLAPAARDPVARARRLGLPGGHRVEGRVMLDGVLHPRLLVATGRRVRVLPLDEDLFPVDPPRHRGRGEVVDLTGRLDTTEERKPPAVRQSTER
jgi:hypothetical protein